MKKKNVINLIKYYTENNDSAFREEAYEIARDFDTTGDYQLGEYIMALLSSANAFVPQMNDSNLTFFKKMESSQDPLPLPEEIKNDIVGIINAIGHNAGVNKFLFQGAPGTGKTETVRQIARILERELFVVDFDSVIDSKLGQTSKNIAQLFAETNSIAHPDKIMILFDEIDSLAMDRTNSNDLREMGRATSSVLKGMDGLNEKIVLIATTNLFSAFDKALVRRFDSVIDFNRYSQDDLVKVGESILNVYLEKFKFAGRNARLFEKILKKCEKLPYPGEFKNIIKTSIAFSDASNEFDYLKRIYQEITSDKVMDLKNLQQRGFTVREIETLTAVSKSQVARALQGDK